jgi:hypothetical protein
MDYVTIRIQLNDETWEVHREVFATGSTEEKVEKIESAMAVAVEKAERFLEGMKPRG